MKIKKSLLLLLGLVCVVVLLVACSKQTSEPQKSNQPAKLSGTIKIGSAMPVTGPAATGAKPNINGIQMAVEDINKSGILGDAKFEVVSEDTATPDMAINAFQKLINQQKVLAIVGPANSQAALASVPLAQQAKVITFAGTGSETVTAVGDYIFSYASPYGDLYPGFMKQVVTARNLKTVALITAKDYEFAVGMNKIRKEEFPKDGVQIVLDESTTLKDTDFGAVVTKIMEKKPDAVVIGGTAPHDALLLTQLKRAGYKGTLLGDGGNSATSITKASVDAFEGVLNVIGYLSGTPGETDKSKDFVQRYKAKYGDIPDLNPAGVYTCLYVLAEAIKKVGNTTDVQAIRDAVASAQISGVIAQNTKFGTKRFLNYSSVIIEVKNGDFVPFTK